MLASGAKRRSKKEWKMNVGRCASIWNDYAVCINGTDNPNECLPFLEDYESCNRTVFRDTEDYKSLLDEIIGLFVKRKERLEDVVPWMSKRYGDRTPKEKEQH